MKTDRSKYIWLALILIVLFFLFKKDRAPLFLDTPPAAKALDFNAQASNLDTRPVYLSADEKINIEVFERVHPAVVNIATTTLGMNFWMEIIPSRGQGSGFVIDGKGYILTNNHVVAKAQKIVITTASGKKIRATLVGRDPRSDLAVIKIPAKEVNAVADLGDSDGIRPGQKAIAIGNPFGLSHTLTTGIVSALNRSIRTEEGYQVDNLIQTDAAINPGNSGGPLLNSSGEVIGINTAIFSLSGGHQGIGFAIPINVAKRIATQLITSGKIARPWLGINGISISEALSEGLGLEVEEGVLVVQVVRGGPAHQAGVRGGHRQVIIGGIRLLLGGDIITSIAGKRVSDMKDMGKILDGMRVGQTITVGILRNTTAKDIAVILTERP